MLAFYGYGRRLTYAWFSTRVLSLHSPSRTEKLTRIQNIEKKEAPWPESASELYRPRDRRLSAKKVPTFADRGCHVVSVADPCGRNLGFLYRSLYFFFQVDDNFACGSVWV
jgi:hypothetical protein